MAASTCLIRLSRSVSSCLLQPQPIGSFRCFLISASRSISAPVLDGSHNQAVAMSTPYIADLKIFILPLYPKDAMQYKDAVERFLQRPWLISLLFVTIGAGVYTGAFLGAFQYDDGFAILLNQHLDRAEVFVGHLDHMVRPVLYATLLVDRTIYGHDPVGYHLVNVLLHIGCGLLIYQILNRAGIEEKRHLPFLTAMLFLVHPIQTEAVTYISGRT